MRYAKANDDQESMNMALTTLRKMRLGGIWDHIGGGFHRYSTDAEWLLPHFEKMLYDQAMLLLSYAEGWRVSRNPLFKDTCYQIFNYLQNNLLSLEGGFYSAEDADSEGEEGKFYVWKKDEIFDHLPKHQAELFCGTYNIKENGNFRDEASGFFTSQNIPHLNRQLSEIAEEKENPDQFLATLEMVRSKLYDIRNKRIPPLLDDKILTDWNSLLMAALASAGAIFDEQKFTDAAINIESFIHSHMMDGRGNLLHRFREGNAAIEAMADDYSAIVWGLTELHQTTQNPEYLEKAVQYQQQFSDKFSDEKHGGFYFTSSETESPMGRQKEIYDGALPSSNSIAALNGFRLSRLTGNTDYEKQSNRILNAFSEVIADNPSAYTFALITKLIRHHNAAEIAVAGNPDDPETEKVLDYLRTQDRFQYSVLLKSNQTKKQLAEIAPFTDSFPLKDEPAVYVCKNFTCDAPVRTLEELKESLEKL